MATKEGANKTKTTYKDYIDEDSESDPDNTKP